MVPEYLNGYIASQLMANVYKIGKDGELGRDQPKEHLRPDDADRDESQTHGYHTIYPRTENNLPVPFWGKKERGVVREGSERN